MYDVGFSLEMRCRSGAGSSAWNRSGVSQCATFRGHLICVPGLPIDGSPSDDASEGRLIVVAGSGLPFRPTSSSLAVGVGRETECPGRPGLQIDAGAPASWQGPPDWTAGRVPRAQTHRVLPLAAALIGGLFPRLTAEGGERLVHEHGASVIAAPESH
jgi:hypothetical protein